MEAQSLQSLSECNQCGKKFQRKAHLLRHQQQHSGERPYSCKFCSKTFKRSDVLRDHFGRCERRGTSAIPSSLERGRKRHACDECSRLKVKCDNEVPCRKCREFGRTCVKSRPQGVLETLEKNKIDGLGLTIVASSPDAEVQHVEHQDASASPDTIGSDRNSIGFLLNCPKETDFHERYPGTRSPSTRAANYSSTIAGTNGYQQSPPSSRADSTQSYDFFGNNIAGEGNVDQLLSSLEFESFERQTNNWPGIQMPGILWSGPETLYIDRSVLEQRALDIRHNLYQTISAQVAPILPSKEVVEAIELLSADKIAYFIKLYFRHWHKHGPIVHEPSFNPCDAAIPLVLALMALGGMYSKDPIDVMKIKVLLDILESYIYSIPGLSDEYDLPGRIYVKPGEDSSPQWQQYQLEEFQGAYLMIVLQYWTGTATARKRVRNSRFGRMVEIYRYLGMHKVQHSPNFMITDQHSFRTWIRKEAYIRTATIAMMLDNAFAIFNNITPRLQWTEIDLHFPAEDHYFAHATYADMLSDPHGLPSPKPKIKDAFMMLFSAEETNWQEDLKLLRFGTLNAMDMQMLMHVFYTTIYSSTFATPLSTLPATSIPTLTGPFKIALTNWKHIWDEIKTAMISSNTWETLGFQRTAETYYDAVKAVIAVFERREGKFPSDIPCDCEKGSHLKLLLSF